MDKRIEQIKRNRRRHILNKSGSITWTTTEPYALCFYLYNMFQNKSNTRIMENFDESIKCFLSCVRSLELSERLSKVLNIEIAELERQNLLKARITPSNEDAFFDDSEIHYKYEQDKKVDRKIHRFDIIDENVVNLHRIMTVTEKPVFSSIINTTVFKSRNDCKLSNSLSFTKKIENAVFDISKTKFLMEQVMLSEDEARYILMKCRFETNDYFRDIIRSADNCDNAFKNCMHENIGITEKDLKIMLRNDNKLKSYGFIDNEGDYDDSLNECIEEQSIDPYFNDLLKPLDCTNAYELKSFAVPVESAEICVDLLKGEKPVSLLFYGKPGSGKTELAKTLGKLTEKKIYVFKNEAENEARNLLGRLVCLLSMGRSDSVLIVDEADTILKTLDFSLFGTEPNKNKGVVNKMLENNKDKVIYIINHQHQIDESTRRRFTFSIKFEAMPQTMLRSIAESKIKPLNISEETKTKVLDLLDKYKLSGASAENIANVIEGMSTLNEETILDKVQIVMKENSLLLNGKTKMRESACKEYDRSIVNATMDPNKIVEMVQNAQSYSEKNKTSEYGVRMLFYGLSGTGKTEFARHIAETLHKPILLKRASDILSMWVGGSEKNIRNAFAEAEQTGSILLFDEADSFFQDRANAQRRWEITQVNEFLTQMEEFSGILICTTNLRKIMDPAMQRRFHILTEFKALSEDGIKTLFKRYFPKLDFTEEQILTLAKYKTATPGDFATIQGRFRFMNEAEQTVENIASELEILQKEKKKNINAEMQIGFTA